MTDIHEKHDLESRVDPAKKFSSEDDQTDFGHGSYQEVKRAHDLQNNIAVFRSLRRGEEWLDAKMGVELQGVDRIPEEKKEPPSIWNVSFLGSINCRRPLHADDPRSS